jgi:glycerol uptake facilitator-like aquaporin
MATGVDLAFFVGIMMAIPICARQTGANLNPAVSYSMALKNEGPSTYTLLWIYIKAQVTGAILSMILALALNDVHRSPLYPSENISG